MNVYVVEVLATIVVFIIMTFIFVACLKANGTDLQEDEEERWVKDWLDKHKRNDNDNQ